MKTLLSIAFGVSMCCLLPSNGMAADEAKPALFTIVSAQYGAGDKWSDVSDKVKAAVQNDALIIDPANSNFGDSIGGTKKSLKVVVKYDGKEFAFQTGIDGTAGNYVVFRNQTAGEFAIFPYCTSPSRIAINGIQIVAGERAISINFTALSDASAVLGSADVAGVIPRANWNNIQYNDNTYGFNPKDDTGTTLDRTSVNCRLKSGYPGNHGYTSTVGNDRLMKYFCGNDEGNDSKRLPLIRVSGLPASFLATGYSIYVYSDFNNNSDPHKIDLGTSLLDTNNQSAGISTICTATIVDSDNWPGSGGGTFTEGATLTINKAVLDAKVKEKAAGEDPAKQILQLTGGARTKIVWSRGVDRPGGFSIMLLDTSEGRERVLATQSSCRIPFITPSGNRVIVDDMNETSDQKRIYVMDMNGNKKELCPAYCAMGVAEDPPGTEWAYYADNKHDAQPPGKLWRVQIDNPKVREMVWDKTSAGWQWAFTRDGKVGCGGLPWPGSHIANLPNGSYQQVHDSGCMVALAPSGRRMLHCTARQFGGEHRGFGVHSAPNWSSCVLINLGDAPGVNNQTLHWPSWALYDERFFVITGPWTKGKRPGNILFGQFNAEFNGIARWVQVTQCPEGLNDCNASCWIQSGPDVKDSPKMDAIKTKPAEDRGHALAAGGWPADRKDLIFLWENRKGASLGYDREGKAIPSLILMPRDRARFDHNQGLWLEAGAFPVPGVEKFLGAQKIAALTLEAYLTPEKGSCPSLAEIVSLSASSDDANLVLGQLGDKLVMTMKGGAKPSELCALTAGEPVHVIVTYAPGKLTCYKNGKPAGVVGNFQGSPANWTEQHLLFGNNWDGKRPWSGHLEGIAIYTRALGPKEAEQEHAAFAEKLKGRKPVPRIEIQAKLLAKTKTRKFEEIAPYTQATAAYEYEVEKVVSGQCKEKKIRVLHHTMIDRKPLPASQAEIGKSYTLELEPLEANPQLDIDRPLDDLPLDLTAVLYYDVGPMLVAGSAALAAAPASAGQKQLSVREGEATWIGQAKPLARAERIMMAAIPEGKTEHAVPAEAPVIPYASPGDKVSTVFTVTVNGTAVNVTEFFGVHYAHLAAAGPVEVVATASENITRFSISPKRLAIPGTVEGKSLRFTINCSQPRYLILFINSLPHLCVLIDQPEVKPPQLTDAHVVNAMDFLTDATGATAQTEGFAKAIAAVNGTGKILFVPAGCYLTDTIRIKDCRDFTLYLAPGCLIRTVLCRPNSPQHISGMTIEDSRNITILGRGVLDNQAFQNYRVPGITYENSGAYPVFGARNQHLTIDGLTARNARNWNYSIVQTDDLVMRQVKAITPPACSPNWTDGINLSSNQGVLIDHAFVYCNDDSFASGHYYTWGSTRDSSGMVIRNMVAWNPRANGIRLGWDCNYNLNDYTFENCDFIGQLEAGIMIHGMRHNGRYTRIRLENCGFEQSQMAQGLVRTAGPLQWINQPGYEPLPQIDSLELVNVTLDAVKPSTIAGSSNGGGIKHLLIDNLVMNGRRCTNLQDARITVSHVDDVVFK